MVRRRKVSDIYRDCQTYLIERASKLKQQSRADTASKPVREYLEKYGTEDPTSGNLVYTFPEALIFPDKKGNDVRYSGVELRKSVGASFFDFDEVKEFVTGLANKLGTNSLIAKQAFVNRVVKSRTEYYLDLDELYAMFHERLVTEKQLRGLMHYPEPTYALWPIEEQDSLDE